MNRMRSLMLLVLAIVGCNSPQGKPMHELAPTINATLRPVDKAIVAGDTLNVEFVDFTQLEGAELSSPVTLVAPDGMLRMPGIESLRVIGRTPEQVAAALVEAYTPVLGVAPAVSVSYVSRVPRTFHILGAVETPGAYPIEFGERVTLVEAFAKAEGFTYLESYMGNVLLMRQDNELQRQVAWIVDARPKWFGENETILLQAGDVVYVPDTTVADVNKWIEMYIIRMIPFPRIFYAY